MGNTNRVVILMGPSGAGKSTWAKAYTIASNTGELRGRVRVRSTDAYMVNEQGDYAFDPARLGACHNECLADFVSSVMHFDGRHIVVDNTNCSIAEIAPYIAVSRAFGIEPEVRLFRVTPETAAARNIHGTPFNVCLAMHAALAKTLAEWPPFWPTVIDQPPTV